MCFSVSLITCLMTLMTAATTNKPRRARATCPHDHHCSKIRLGDIPVHHSTKQKGLNVCHLNPSTGLGLNPVLQLLNSHKTGSDSFRTSERRVSQSSTLTRTLAGTAESSKFRSSQPKSSLQTHLWIFQFLRRWSVHDGGIREEAGSCTG